MSAEEAAKAAANLIWQHWQDGTVMDALPPSCRPADRRQGYGVQMEVAARSRQRPTGWKIAATSLAGQTHIGVSGPLAGRLLGERTFRSGATLSLASNRMRVAEPEFAFRCGKRLLPRPTPYTPEEVVAAMDALIPAIEAPDSRFADFARAGEGQLIAECACAHEFILGEPARGDAWRALDLSRHPTKGTVVGRYTREGSGGNVLGDPRIALAWLVNELSGLGIALEPGEIVTTGTSLPPLEVQPGDHVVADFGGLGEVEARFV